MEKTLIEIFARVLNLPQDSIIDDLRYNKEKAWDSIGHMAIVAGIDDAFGIMLDTDDILAMNSFKEAKRIVGKYVGTHERAFKE